MCSPSPGSPPHSRPPPGYPPPRPSAPLSLSPPLHPARHVTATLISSQNLRHALDARPKISGCSAASRRVPRRR
eukprot:scaffold112302_cov67-Phaeocystis_antarctica.AAC.7